jgi:hypothetical protein
MYMMQLSLNPLPLASMQGEALNYAEKALNSYNKLQTKKYGSTDFQPKNEFNYNAMETAFSLEEQMNGDFTERLKDLNGQSGRGGQTQGCFIATAVYGCYDCPEVLVLRRFRDEVLMKSFAGRSFVKFYYKIGPFIAKTTVRIPLLSSILRFILDRMVRTWK